jgi:hypothetical protein
MYGIRHCAWPDASNVRVATARHRGRWVLDSPLSGIFLELDLWEWIRSWRSLGYGGAMSWIQHGTHSLPNVLAVQADDAGLLNTHLAFYRHVMFGPSGLSRQERELLAVAVSTLNRCFY